ncbi:MAG: glycosyltransferase [Firmicutes bacterium]|nr:glycosyltransferase [Bacillota bacterium]
MCQNIKYLCFITGLYPTDDDPVYTFVDTLIQELVNIDIHCTVIAPQNITQGFIKKKRRRKRVITRYTNCGKQFTIYCPPYTSYSNKTVLGFNTHRLTQASFERAIINEFKQRKIKADVLYAQFFMPCGIAAVKLGKMLNMPVFVANGEYNLNSIQSFNSKLLETLLEQIIGIISVSEENKRQLLVSGYDVKMLADKIDVIKNAVDRTVFYPIDKQKARLALGLPQDNFIVAFTGSFIERKGVSILAEVIDQLENVFAIFIGQGPLEPKCRNILFKGTLPNKLVNQYLSAADIFVLPTLAEGCSNAIIEAIACGLPVVSSALPFNDEILDENCSLRVNPKSHSEIKGAITLLYKDELLRKKLAQGALEKSRSTDISVRAKAVMSFMNSKYRLFLQANAKAESTKIN